MTNSNAGLGLTPCGPVQGDPALPMQIEDDPTYLRTKFKKNSSSCI